VDAQSIVVAVLQQLARRREVKAEAPREAFDKYQLTDVNAAGTGTVGGDA
jgi:pyruvate dehydrogenase E1 component